MKIVQLAAAVLAMTAAIAAQTQTVQPSTQEFGRLKSLSGEWVGTAVHEGQEMLATTSFRVVADGSVVMADLVPGTPHEMITMFHMNGNELLATHYCSHHNQPRLVAMPAAAPNVLEFQFKDATNPPKMEAPHMTHVKLTILDANHHLEEWTATANGVPVVVRFDFHRKL